MLDQNTLSDKDFLDLCFHRYRIDCERFGAIYQQPSSVSYVEGDVAVLLNVRGEMARYRLAGQNVYRIGIDR